MSFNGWFSFKSLPNLCVLGVSAVMEVETETARDPENEKVGRDLKQSETSTALIQT